MQPNSSQPTSLDDIALFVAVARHKSFTRGADALDMPASTLSRRISQLERTIGVRLLKRSTRRVELTEAGAVYFERCQHIVDEARIAHEQLIEAACQPKGRLRISMPASFALMFLPAAILEFTQLYPDIECEYDLGIRPLDLLVEPVDILIRIGNVPDSGLVAHRLGNIRLGLYASVQYLASHGIPTTPADLSRHECLRTSASREDSVWQLYNGTTMQEVQVKGRMALNNVIMLSRMASLGAGIVPLSLNDLAHRGEAEPLTRILPDWEFAPIPLLALFPSRLLPVRTRAFVDFLSKKVEQSNKGDLPAVC
ncbi:LysR substrate-binding domain-containing protein [Allopusillimonas ginsengisoli]|uniref:LysR family transcriptional regulator n=1 Tax=Allopusillimonas ginsengisoli TaxID=453575 RepID=UPI0010C1ED60|nr:LysR family transcriptional regulator [Allopusillimonas ginsengisoli]